MVHVGKALIMNGNTAMWTHEDQKFGKLREWLLGAKNGKTYGPLRQDHPSWVCWCVNHCGVEACPAKSHLLLSLWKVFSRRGPWIEEADGHQERHLCGVILMLTCSQSRWLSERLFRKQSEPLVYTWETWGVSWRVEPKPLGLDSAEVAETEK